jgi:hypothetical protein
MGGSAERGRAIDTWIIQPVEAAGRHTAAALNMLGAAGKRDEGGSAEEARRCRELAVRYLQDAEETGERITSAGLPGTQLLLAETLRRLGRFEEAERCCHRGLSGRPQDPVRSVLEFETELVMNRDSTRHSVDEVL